MSKLTGKVAVVTGASKGIGAAIAKSLAAEGASVVVNYASSKAGADAVVTAITAAGGKAVAVGGDVSKAAEAQGIIDAAIQNFGRLDILVNNSGVYEFSPDRSVHRRSNSTRYSTSTSSASCSPRRPPSSILAKGSSIINIGSVVSSMTPPNSAVYTATKGAVDAITGVLARSSARRRSASTPSTPAWSRPKAHTPQVSSAPTSRKALVAQTPLGRIGQADDIASVATFLASEDSKWLTGELFRAGGGLR